MNVNEYIPLINSDLTPSSPARRNNWNMFSLASRRIEYFKLSYDKPDYFFRNFSIGFSTITVITFLAIGVIKAVFVGGCENYGSNYNSTLPSSNLTSLTNYTITQMPKEECNEYALSIFLFTPSIVLGGISLLCGGCCMIKSCFDRRRKKDVDRQNSHLNQIQDDIALAKESPDDMVFIDMIPRITPFLKSEDFKDLDLEELRELYLQKDDAVQNIFWQRIYDGSIPSEKSIPFIKLNEITKLDPKKLSEILNKHHTEEFFHKHQNLFEWLVQDLPEENLNDSTVKQSLMQLFTKINPVLKTKKVSRLMESIPNQIKGKEKIDPVDDVSLCIKDSEQKILWEKKVSRSFFLGKSEALHKMLKGEFKEKEEELIQIQETDPSAMNMIVEWCQDPKTLIIDENNWQALLENSNFYGFLEIKTTCENWMIQNMNNIKDKGMMNSCLQIASDFQLTRYRENIEKLFNNEIENLKNNVLSDEFLNYFSFTKEHKLVIANEKAMNVFENAFQKMGKNNLNAQAIYEYFKRFEILPVHKQKHLFSCLKENILQYVQKASLDQCKTFFEELWSLGNKQDFCLLKDLVAILYGHKDAKDFFVLVWLEIPQEIIKREEEFRLKGYTPHFKVAERNTNKSQVYHGKA